MESSGGHAGSGARPGRDANDDDVQRAASSFEAGKSRIKVRRELEAAGVSGASIDELIDHLDGPEARVRQADREAVRGLAMFVGAVVFGWLLLQTDFLAPGLGLLFIAAIGLHGFVRGVLRRAAVGTLRLGGRRGRSPTGDRERSAKGPQDRARSDPPRDPPS